MYLVHCQPQVVRGREVRHLSNKVQMGGFDAFRTDYAKEKVKGTASSSYPAQVGLKVGPWVSHLLWLWNDTQKYTKNSSTSSITL